MHKLYPFKPKKPIKVPVEVKIKRKDGTVAIWKAKKIIRDEDNKRITMRTKTEQTLFYWLGVVLILGYGAAMWLMGNSAC